MTSLADVPNGFDMAAPRYDLLTAMNPGYRRHLLAAADSLVAAMSATKSARLLDLGCGSGASTRAMLSACQRHGVRAAITGIDSSAGMLDVARSKRWPASVGFRHASVDDPDTFAGLDGSADCVFAAYLFRNLSDREAALRRVHETLVPGGTLVVVDYSVADSRRARLVWSAVCRGIITPASVLVGGDPELYRYLRRSVLAFDGARRFAQKCVAAGFTDVQRRTVSGWQRDILHVFSMTKPPEGV